MKVLDLFSGIGGFALGLERAGMETVAFCEYDEKARLVLNKHWPDVPMYNDVKTLTGEQLEKDGITDIGLICGGYPCQPFSVAGKREGQADDRHLWPEFFRLIQETRPTWVIAENVAGHINMGLEDVLADLESEGYQCQTFLIPACAVGAIHRRDRIWILAYSDLSHGKGGRVSSGIREGNTNPYRRSADWDSSEDVAHASSKRQQGQRESIEPVDSKESGKEKTTDAFSGGQYGVWATEPSVGRVANGVSGRVDRLKQLGNAVVPQIPEVIGRFIMEIENGS